MEPTTTLAIGLLAAAGTALVAVARGWRRRAARGGPVREAIVPAPSDETRPLASGPAQGPLGPAHLRPARIVVVGDPRQPIGPRATAGSGQAGSPLDPRRRLLRDASAVLLAVAVVVLAVTALSSGPDPNGGVLSATATPATGSAALVGPATPGAPSALEAAGASASSAPPAAASPAPGAAASRPASSAVPSVPSAGRLALLQACPGRTDCYLYVVRTGDTLLRISAFFGVPADAILRLNRAITDPSIVVRGSTIVLPTPTR